MIWWQKPRLCSSSNCSQWRGFCGTIIPHIKTNQRNEKKIHIFSPGFLTLLVAYLNSTTTSTFIYLWTQDKYVCWICVLSFFSQSNYLPLFTICSLCPTYSFLFIFQFFFLFCVERIFLWFCKHVSLEQVFTHSPDSAGVFLMCFHYLLCNIQSKALISSIAVWQREYLSVTLYDGWQIKGKNKAS